MSTPLKNFFVAMRFLFDFVKNICYTFAMGFEIRERRQVVCPRISGSAVRKRTALFICLTLDNQENFDDFVAIKA